MGPSQIDEKEGTDSHPPSPQIKGLIPTIQSQHRISIMPPRPQRLQCIISGNTPIMDEGSEYCAMNNGVEREGRCTQRFSLGATNGDSPQKGVLSTTTKRRGPYLFLVLFVGVIAVLSCPLRLHAALVTITTRHEEDRNRLPPKLQELGWMDTIEHFRTGVALASVTMQQQHVQEEAERKKKGNHNHGNKTLVTAYDRYTTDISPYYDLVFEAVDTVGVKGLIFDVFFEGLGYYGLAEDDDCKGSEGHGYMCAHYGFWWFYHFTGSILAEKLLLEGKLLWDPMATGEQKYVTSFVNLQEQIHLRQTLPAAWEMSIHVQHGLLWHYAMAKQPDMDEFPTQMVYDWCGRWVHTEHYMEAIGKRVGFACVHGFGHMAFYLAARAQLDPEKTHPLSARRQIRSMSGFVLNHDSVCRVRQICLKADDMVEGWTSADGSMNLTTNTANRCKGGAVHSMKLMINKLRGEQKNKDQRNEASRFFYRHHAKCEEEEETARMLEEGAERD